MSFCVLVCFVKLLQRNSAKLSDLALFGVTSANERTAPSAPSRARRYFEGAEKIPPAEPPPPPYAGGPRSTTIASLGSQQHIIKWLPTERSGFVCVCVCVRVCAFGDPARRTRAEAETVSAGQHGKAQHGIPPPVVLFSIFLAVVSEPAVACKKWNEAFSAGISSWGEAQHVWPPGSHFFLFFFLSLSFLFCISFG